MRRHGSGKGRKGRGKERQEGESARGNGREQARDESPSPTSTRASKIWIFISAFLLLVSVGLLFYTLRARSEIRNYDANLVNCAMELDNLEQEKQEIENDLRRAKADLDAMSLGQVNRAGLSSEYIELYEKRGLRNPTQSIIADVMKHPELIPYNPAEGRNFRFSRRQEVHILSPDRILATFTDGPTEGWLLLSYRVREGGEITYKVVESYCSRCEK